MAQYILLIQGNSDTDPTSEEWESFFFSARKSGFFKGGSEMGKRFAIGNDQSAVTTDHIVGFMRFDTDDLDKLKELLSQHPVVLNGGSVELCEMPRS